MATLLVRNLDDRVAVALRERAARHRRSVEAEHRAILEAALIDPETPDFKQFLLAMPDGGGDELFTRATDLPRDVHL